MVGDDAVAIGKAYVYILRCQDGTLYTGCTADLQRRLSAHRTGRGSKYVRGRLPVELVYQETCASRTEALRRELRIKRMTREEKLELLERGHHPARALPVPDADRQP